ncbi:Uncharacterised protein [Mycobacteroides abscessus subsp. abscessus]|nr:Uncharacterised protein [Mycobacteroides abscessus subsp. abscessus]
MLPARPLPSWNAPLPSSDRGGWPTIASTGTALAYDSASAGTRLTAPPPDVVATTLIRDVTRAYPSAIVPAENSCLATTACTPGA